MCCFRGEFGLAFIWAIQAAFCSQARDPLCDVDRNPLFSPNNFTWGHFMKIEWLVTDVTAVGSPDRAERASLGVILAGCFVFAN